MATRTKVPDGFDTIHKILGAAMRASEPAVWPARPHLGGPLPVLPTRAQVDIGFHLARVVRPPDPAAFDELIADAHRALDAGSARALDAATKRSTKDPGAIAVAKLVGRGVVNHLNAGPSARDSIGTCVANAAAAAVALVADPRAFLAALDADIVRAELVARLAERDLAPAIERVVARPAGARGLGCVVASLADGTYGLWAKLKNRWEWHAGDRASVFATVPDAYMDAVAPAFVELPSNA